MSAAAPSIVQAQSFGEIHVERDSSLVINQTIVISPDAVQARPFVERSPYIGLRRFDEKDQALFFGRDQVVAKLLRAVHNQRFTLVAGASGSGKSSVVRAGLIPLLHQRMARLRVLTMVPDRDPFERLYVALVQAGFAIDQAAKARTVSAETLTTICAELRAKDESWLIFIDQFEEIFTLCADLPRRKTFLDALCRLIESGTTEVKLVAAMRADFFDRFDTYPQLLELAQKPSFITSPSEAELRLCIEQPAAHHGVTFEAGLVREILNDLQGQPGALPLLQYALDLLWQEDKPADDKTLNTVNYRALGGISGALKQRADELFEIRVVDRQSGKKEPRPQQEREAIRRMLLRLLDLSEHDKITRAISNRASLTEFPPEEQRLIAEWVDEKLLVTNRSDEKSTVEVAHESLLLVWPRLHEWIHGARAAIYARNRLRNDAELWDKARQTAPARAHDELWTGSRLQGALDLDATGEFARLGGLSPLMREFLAESRALCDRRAREEIEKQHQRTRYLRIGIVLLSVFLIITGGIAFYARQKQKEAEQRELDMLVEDGRQLLVDRDKLVEAALKLHGALERGSKSPILPYLLKQAIRPVDAMQMTLQGHRMLVNSAEFSTDDRRIVSASDDKTVRIWDAHSGRQILALQGHQAEVNNAEFSADGRHIVSASNDKTVRLWDAYHGQQLLSLQGHQDAVYCAGFSADGRRIVSASNDKTVRVWDAYSGQQLLLLQGHHDKVISAAFSADGRRIVSASWDKSVRIWDAYSGQQLLELAGHLAEVNGVGFSTDGRRIVSASSDRTVRVWDAHSGQLLLSLRGHQGPVVSAGFSGDGRRIVSASWDQSIRMWDAYSGQQLLSLQGQQDAVYCAEFSADGRRIVSASSDHTVRVWDAQGAQQVLSLQGQGTVRNAGFSTDGRRIVSASNDKTVRVWDAESGQQLLALQGHKAWVNSAGFSADGRRIVSASWDESVRIWDAERGQQLLLLQGHHDKVMSAAFSADGRRIVSASWDKSVRVWDAYSGQQLLALQGHHDKVMSAAFSADGRRIVSASWDKSVRIWDAGSGQQLLELQGHQDPVYGAQFSADGQRIVSASWDQSVRIWDAYRGQLLLSLRGHQGPVMSAGFSGDGRRIVSGSWDQSVRVWDAYSGQLLLSLQGHQAEVNSVGFNRDGRRIVSGSDDGSVRVWDAAPDTRSNAQLAQLLRCRVPLRLQGAAILPVDLDPVACQGLPAPPPAPSRWEDRDSALWTGVYALQAGHIDSARTAFREARDTLGPFHDELLLAFLNLAEATLDTEDKAPCPSIVLATLRAKPAAEQGVWSASLANFVHNELHRPEWALSLLDIAIAATTPERRLELEASRVKVQLAAGQVDTVLQQGPSVWESQTNRKHKVVLASLLALAAAQHRNEQAHRMWAGRANEAYSQLGDKETLAWQFHGIRHAYENQPDSPIRTHALELFTLLEQPKSDELAQKLAKELAIAAPQSNSAARQTSETGPGARTGSTGH